METDENVNKRSSRALSYAVVCASNQNRSMEAHAALKLAGFNVSSYGTSREVKLPGASMNEPNVYSFGTPYKKIYDELKGKNENLYNQNGILVLLTRNMGLKESPEQFQKEIEKRFDVIITYELRVYEAVLFDITSRGCRNNYPVYIININTRDNQNSAALAAASTVRLAKQLEKTNCLEDEFDRILDEFNEIEKKDVLYTLLFY